MLCIDIDECKTGEDNCHTDAECVNEEPGFRCQCKPGYSGDGLSCTGETPIYLLTIFISHSGTIISFSLINSLASQVR